MLRGPQRACDDGRCASVWKQPKRRYTTDGKRQGERLRENAHAALVRNVSNNVCVVSEKNRGVDFMTTGSWGAWAVKEKTGSFSTHDLRALAGSCSWHREFRARLGCDHEGIDRVRDLSVTVMPWDEYL